MSTYIFTTLTGKWDCNYRLEASSLMIPLHLGTSNLIIGRLLRQSFSLIAVGFGWE
jgi:hypothetical protein